MKSKTSCFNWTVCKKDLFRSWPLWGLWLMGWLTALPVRLLNVGHMETEMDMVRYLTELAVASTHVLPMLYAAAVALLLFSYQYNSRSANFFGALPLRREGLFLSKFVTGLCCCVLPNLLTALLTAAVGAAKGMNLTGPAAVWLGASLLAYFFYFSFASFCAMVVGHMAAMPVVYGLLLFAAVVVEQIARGLMELFVYGFTARGDMTLLWLSPVVKTLDSVHMNTQWSQDYEKMLSCTFEGWDVLLVYAAVGLVFLALAFFFHKHRRMESAGDVIAVRHLKPLFLYGFTLGCCLCLGYLLTGILFDGVGVKTVGVGVCLLIGASIGYFGGEMLLHKSLHVFRKRHLLNCGVVCILIVAMLGCLRLDLFHIADRVPMAAEVESLSFDWSNMYRVRDSELIQSVIDVHQEIVDRQQETEDLLDGRHIYHPEVRLTYNLKNGRSFTRTYALPVTPETAADPNSLVNLFDDMYNAPDMIVERELPPDLTEKQIENCFVYSSDYDESWRLTGRETLRLLREAVIPDMRDGLIGVDRMAENIVAKTAETAEPGAADVAAVEVNRELYLEIVYRGDYTSPGGSCHLTIPTEAHRTWALLAEYGIPPEE